MPSPSRHARAKPAHPSIHHQLPIHRLTRAPSSRSTHHTRLRSGLVAQLSSGEISAPLAGKVDSSDNRVSDSRTPTVHRAAVYDSTVEAVANKDLPSGHAGLDDFGLIPGAEIPYGSTAHTACAGDDPRLDWNRILTDGASVLVGATGNAVLMLSKGQS